MKIALFGECMLELRGEAFGTMAQSFGGDTLNAAVYLARSSRREALAVCYATALGTDAFSDGMVSRWHAEGLDTGLVRRLPDRSPGLYMISVDAQGERQFAYWRKGSAATAYFGAGSTPLEASAGELDALYFSGISLAILPPEGRQRLFSLAAEVKRHGGRVIFDNNYRPRLWASAAQAREAFASAYAMADIALVTIDDEQALHADLPHEEAVRRSLALPVPEVVLKRGALPTLVRHGAAMAEVPAIPVARVVDTTAAGDSFAGAYLAQRLTGASTEASARAGNRMAAAVIQHQGAIIPRDAMEEFLRRGE
ncbi:sugar kinase [Paracidovorax cattleyae]|uniref:sugar kinase n=1 Tax=Paracidovorax cattleyae TaxID=80868 RepID=UPI0018AF9F81|nr:sugar kinase [Paracidovorax cattleyae]MBF9265929.1 sugar kinase [Paracidovorax cattleyae]